MVVLISGTKGSWEDLVTPDAYACDFCLKFTRFRGIISVCLRLLPMGKVMETATAGPRDLSGLPKGDACCLQLNPSFGPNPS